MRERAVGIIVKDQNVLLIRRVKEGREYYVFPGGGVEAGESPEDALKREIKEETSLEVIKFRLLFKFTDEISDGIYFLVEEFSGTVSLGGPEKEHMNDRNQYHLEWVAMPEISSMENMLPREAAIKARELLKI